MFPAMKLSTIVLLVFACVVGTTAVATYEAGAVRISVQEKAPGGEHIRLIVPALLVPVGLHFIPEKELRKQSAEMRQWLPVIRAASQELERCPDATLVEVKGPDENVSIRKRGDSMVIDVDDRDETVHVSFPLRVVTTAVRRLEVSNPPV